MVMQEMSDPAEALKDLANQDETPDKHDLFFLEPVFHSGFNVTVRNGEKWMEAKVGDRLLLKKTGDDKVIHTAYLCGKAFMPFRMIPERWLAIEHDPKCRTLKGLLKHGMKPAYPDFTKDSFVTVLFFWI